MTETPFSVADEERALDAARAILANLGITSGRGGNDVDALAAAVYANGGSYAIDLVAGAYRAEVRSQQPGQAEPSGAGYGPTPAAALTFALVEALTETAIEYPPRRASGATQAREADS